MSAPQRPPERRNGYIRGDTGQDKIGFQEPAKADPLITAIVCVLGSLFIYGGFAVILYRAFVG